MESLKSLSFKNRPIHPSDESPVLDKSTSLSKPIDSTENPRGHDHPNGSDEGDDEEYGDMDETCTKIDALIDTMSSVNDKSDIPEVPEFVETFIKMMKSQMNKHIRRDSPFNLEREKMLMNRVIQLSRLSSLLEKLSPDGKVNSSLGLSSHVIPQAMGFMEMELRILMQEGCNKANSEGDEEMNNYPGMMNQDIIEIMRKIVDAMIWAGFHKDCCQAYTSVRKDAFKEALKSQGGSGLDSISNAEDVQKMAWENLEGHIADWVKLAKHVAKVLLPGENNLCVSVFFPHHSSNGETIITNLTKPIVTSLLNLAEAVSLSKRSAEKLFKVLDMYEALTDLIAALDSSNCPQRCISDLRSEILVIRRRLRDTVVAIFGDLENSIKTDVARSPVPGGAVHPLTRYTINYLGYACDFRDTLETIFSTHYNNNDDEIQDSNANNHKNQSSFGSESDSEAITPNKYVTFAAELTKIMNLLDDNLEAKSKLYKDPSLRYIFLMNNGRYVLQKIKESAEIREVMGDDFRRKRSSDLRGYHKSYQRETWSRVLQCLNQDGLQVLGKVQKTIVKERLKSFNQMFDDIHKTQSAWVVSDKQLQSELRVSISAVMIPAYRSFLARFGQCFGSGKQAERYIKYQPEDIESAIEALFDGNGQNLSMARRKLSFPH